MFISWAISVIIVSFFIVFYFHVFPKVLTYIWVYADCIGKRVSISIIVLWLYVCVFMCLWIFMNIFLSVLQYLYVRTHKCVWTKIDAYEKLSVLCLRLRACTYMSECAHVSAGKCMYMLICVSVWLWTNRHYCRPSQNNYGFSYPTSENAP